MQRLRTRVHPQVAACSVAGAFPPITEHPELHADFATRRASGERLLKLDVFGLRHRLPRSWYVWSYEHALPVVYRALGSGKTGIGSGLDESHLFIDEKIEDTTPCLFATARSPRR